MYLITSKLENVLIDRVVPLFPKYVQSQLFRPQGHVEVLIGLFNVDIFPLGPTPIAKALGICRTIFGSGYILAGSNRSLKQNKTTLSNEAQLI